MENKKQLKQYREEAYKIGLSKYDADEYIQHRIDGMTPDQAYMTIINDILRQV